MSLNLRLSLLLKIPDRPAAGRITFGEFTGVSNWCVIFQLSTSSESRMLDKRKNNVRLQCNFLGHFVNILTPWAKLSLLAIPLNLNPVRNVSVPSSDTNLLEAYLYNYVATTKQVECPQLDQSYQFLLHYVYTFPVLLDLSLPVIPILEPSTTSSELPGTDIMRNV